MGFGISTSRNTTQQTLQTNTENQIGQGDGGLSAASGSTVNTGSQVGLGASRSNISVQTSNTYVDPGSYAFASDVVKNLSGLGAQFAQSNSDIASKAQDTVTKLAQGTTLGVDWKTKLVPIAAIAGGVLLVIGILFRPRKKA